MKFNFTRMNFGNNGITYNHLLIIFVLALSFSTSFLLRSIPSFYGWELMEFDPFFNFRATEYLVNNGIDAYFSWNDELSWYPNGRDVSSNSQVILHLTSGLLYSLFDNFISLYDFVIIFPVIIGSLTTIGVFFLVRLIFGNTAGLLASLLFSFSVPVILRGMIGWFKSEPLGLFFSIFSIYLFLSGLQRGKSKENLIRLIFSGLLFSFSLSAWGGNQFFVIPIGIYIISLVFTRNDGIELVKKIPFFIISVFLFSLFFERPGLNFIASISGISLISSYIFFGILQLIKIKSSEKNRIRNSSLFLISIIIFSLISIEIISSLNLIGLPTHRYLNALNPLLTTTDPLVDSISEHATTSLQSSFFLHGTLIIFAGFAVWFIFKNYSNFINKDLKIFALIFGISGAYVSSTFMRLELFASISIIILSSIGISEILKRLFKKSNLNKSSKITFTILVSFGLITILFLPLISSNSTGIFTVLDTPPTILNGGTSMKISTNDWNSSLDWIKNNTPKDAIIASWWDYGYWIQTKGERATLVDNATLSTEKIQKIAKILLSDPLTAWKSLNSMETDYVVIFVAGQRLTVNGLNDQGLYTMDGGGDESKKFWFIKIAEQPIQKFLHPDNLSGTDYFWNETLLGKMIPFQVVGYYDSSSGNQFSSYIQGTIPIYEKNVKFDEDDVFELVYASPSFDAKPGEPVIGIFVYKINTNYIEN